MKTRHSFAIRHLIWLPLLLLAAYLATGQENKGNRRTYGCSTANPQSTCNPSTTCGSPTEACRVNIKRTDYSASATPSISGVKEGAPFCVKVGTTITFESSSKNTGFTLDFGPTSPFANPGAIIGGSARSVSLIAEKPGCYKYSTGACNTEAIYGMCAEGNSELIVIDK